MVFKKIIRGKEGGYIIKTLSFLATFYTHSAETDTSKLNTVLEVSVSLCREMRAPLSESFLSQAESSLTEF